MKSDGTVEVSDILFIFIILILSLTSDASVCKQHLVIVTVQAKATSCILIR